MDIHLFQEALYHRLALPYQPALTVKSDASWLTETITEACDLTMTRVWRVSRSRSVYWWSEKIAALRRDCIRHRRAFFRRRPHDATEVGRLKERLRNARRTLRNAIRTAKARAWQELVKSIDRDLWGRPYLIVMDRLRLPALPLTETLDLAVGRGYPQCPLSGRCSGGATRCYPSSAMVRRRLLKESYEERADTSGLDVLLPVRMVLQTKSWVRRPTL